MPATSACPSPKDLQQFAVGKLSDPGADALARHLAQCRRCLETLHDLKVDDTLLEAMRSQASVAQRPDHPVLKNLISQLSKLRVASPGVSASAETTQAGNHGEKDVQPIDFLAPSQGPGELGRLGSYRILKVLGQGGMGVVFQAEDAQLKRAVAVKAMLPEVAKKTAARERFLREACAAAALEHDHIVAIYHVGEEGGVPYLVMPMLKGCSLEEFLKKKQADRTGTSLTVGQILKLGREMAKGLAAAHAVGLIHRDIKPANVWLDATAGGRAEILDFGLARPAESDATLTQSGVIVGTPAYMAPEQAQGLKVDGRADLFSLGCVLYRLCTGRLPWTGETAMATLMAVAMEEAAPLAQLRPDLPPALAELVMKLLAKKPEDRPKSANVVVETIQAIERQLTDDKLQVALPLQAATPAAPAPFTGGTVVLGAAPVREKRAAIAWVSSSSPRRRWAVAAAVLLLASIGLAGAAIIYRIQTDNGELVITTDDPDVEVVIKQNGKLVRIIDTKTKKEVKLNSGLYELELKGQPEELKLSLDKVTIRRGETVVATVERRSKQGGVAGKTAGKNPEFLYALPWLDEQQGFSSHLFQTEISSDGRLFVALGDTGPAGAIRVCEVATGKQVQVLIPRGDVWYGFAKFLPGSKWLVASYSQRKELYLYEIATGRVVRRFIGHEKPGPQFTVSPNGKLILSWSDDKTLRLWDVATGTEIRKFEGHADKAAGVFSPDGTKILSFSPDLTLRLWSVETGEELKKLVGHTGAPTGCFAPDGKQALSYGADATIRLWDLATGKQIRQYEGPTDKVEFAGFLADGRLVVGRSKLPGKKFDGDFRIWDAKSGKLLRAIDCSKYGGDGWSFTATPDGRQGIVNHFDGSIRVIDLVTGKETHRFNGCRKARAFSFSPDGTTVVAGSFRAGVFVFRLAPPPAGGGWNLSAK